MNSWKRLFPFCGLSLHSGNCFPCCAEAFKFDAVPFVNFCFYFLGNWNPVQKIAAYAYVFQCLLRVDSKIQVLHEGP
jgi:hypothetical protein